MAACFAKHVLSFIQSHCIDTGDWRARGVMESLHLHFLFRGGYFRRSGVQHGKHSTWAQRSDFWVWVDIDLLSLY